MISVLMPAYNSAPWIEDAIRSVMAQTFTDWELLVCDDGSTDATASILERLAEEDQRIRLFRLPHQGVASVRNYAIQAAEGERIAFLDSDDIWPQWNLQLLLNVFENAMADISCGKLVEFPDREEKSVLDNIVKSVGVQQSPTPEILTGEECVKRSLYQKGVSSSLSGKIFRKDLFVGRKMNGGEIYEDLDLFYRVALGARRVAVVPTAVYLYRQRAGSIIHTFSRRRLDVLKVTERMERFVDENYPSLQKAALDRRFSANFNMLVEITRHLGGGDCSFDNKREFEKERDEIMKFLRDNSGNELRNKNVRIKNRLGALLLMLIPSDKLLYKILTVL